MSLALSLDLRRRVVAAVDEEGLTHRQAAERFKVSAASVSRWRAQAREKGEPRAGPVGRGPRAHFRIANWKSVPRPRRRRSWKSSRRAAT